MKKIELKTVDAVLLGEKQEFSYKDMLQILLEVPENPERGASIAEVRQSIRLLDILEKADNIMEVEDADFEYLLRRVQNAKWASANKVFVDFVNHFEELDG